MKLRSFCLSLLLPVVAVAGNVTRHTVFPGVEFGMPLGKAASGLSGFSTHYVGTMGLRHHLITSNTIAPGKLASLDKDIPIMVVPNDGDTLSSIQIKTAYQQAEGYESIHSAWLDFKDIADSKFRHVGATKPFPAVADFGGEAKEIVTDSWEAEGMHVDLVVFSIHAFNQQGTPDPSLPMRYSTLLRVTEAAK